MDTNPESVEKREKRMRSRRERERARRASETAEQREERLRKRRMRDRARRASQATEDREARLQQRRYRLDAETAEEREARLAAETPDEREARLQHMSTYQHERLAAETPEEREARLQHMSTYQHERLAAETAEEREVRLQCDRQRHRDQQLVQSQLPLFEQHSIRAKMHKFHAHFTMLDLSTCTTCLESFPGLQLHLGSAECLHCSRDKHIPKLYSSANNMDPGPIPSELQVGNNITVMSSYVTDMCSFLQGLTQVEEMLISGVLPIMSLYRLPHGQYAYSGHVINLPQDVASFVNSLPRLPTEFDIIVVRKQGAADSHHDFRVRRSVVLAALQWLLANNKYYRSVQINSDALALLPEDGNLTGLRSVTLDSVADDSEAPSVEDVDPYDAHLSGSFVPNTTQRLTEEETVRQSVQERQSHQQPVSPPTVSWPPMRATSHVPSPNPNPNPNSSIKKTCILNICTCVNYIMNQLRLAP